MKKKNRRTMSTKAKSAYFDPAISENDLQLLEANYNTTWGVKRRIMLLVLSMSSEQLIEKFGDIQQDEEDFFTIIEEIDQYRNHLKEGIQIAESALARMGTVGNHIVEHSK